MRKLIIFAVCICMLVSMMPNVSFAATEADRELIFVAPNGDDNAAGSIENPLASIKAARDKIRQLKKSGVNPKKGFVVYMRGGEYSLTESLVLTAEDSGTAEAPVVYRGYPGEKATFIGGSTLPNKKFQQVTDKAILERVVDSVARAKLMQINLKEIGISHIPPIEKNLRGQYSYVHKFLSEADKPKGGSMELLFNGTAMELSRYPNSGGIEITKVEPFGGDASDVGGVGSLRADPNAYVTITFNDPRINSWTNAEEMAISGNMTYEWADESMPVGTVSPSTKSITTTRPPYYLPLAGNSFYAYNLLEEIDAPGEYFIDSKKGILYFYPPSDISKADILLTVFDGYGVHFNGASHVKVTNLEFKGFRNTPIYFGKGSYNLVSRCEVSYTSQTAIMFKGATFAGDPSENYYSGVTDCYVHDVNNGISIDGGNFETLERGNNYAINNHAERYSRLQKTYMSGVTVGGVGNRMEYNEIHNGPHCGSLWSGNFNKILYNEYYDVCKETGDMGAIYTGQSWVNRGNEVKYNYVHDIPKIGTMSTYGIYLDGGMCDVAVIGNVLENLNRAIYVNGGADNIVLNNIAVNTDEGIRMSSAVIDDTRAGGTLVERMSAHVNKFMEFDVWRESYPEMVAQFAEGSKPEEPRGNLIQNNLSVGNADIVVFESSAAGYTQPGEIANNVKSSKDPGFYNMEERNYYLREDAEIYNKIEGFKAVPFTRMGRLNERADTRIQEAIILDVNSPYTIVNGKETMVDPENRKVVPKIVDSFTFVPLRFIAEALGSTVEYDGETGEISISNSTTTLKITVGSTSAVKNGEAFEMQNAPFIEEGRTLVPLREISNLFGKSVFWHDIGFIAISDNEALFDAEKGTDDLLIEHIYNRIWPY